MSATRSLASNAGWARARRAWLGAFASALCLAVLCLTALSCSTAARKLKWAHVYETSEPFHTSAVWASEQIKQRTQGRIEIQVFPASSLGKETDLNQGLQLGTVDIITSGMAFAARSYPRLTIAYYPFLFRDADHLLAYAKSEVFRELTDGFRSKTGVQILAYAYYGARQVSAQREFGDCAGMAGLKIRVPDVPIYAAFPRACGANPTPIAFAEVYLALQNGTVDAQENPLTTILAKKFNEVQKHIMLTGHIIDGVATQVAGPVWSALGAEDQQVVREVAQEAAVRATDAIKKRELELMEEFERQGLGVHTLERQSFKDAVQKALPLESLGLEPRDYERIVAIP